MSNSVQDGSVGTFPTDSTLGQYLRVEMGTDGYLNVAGLAVQDIGTTVIPVVTSGDDASVRFRNAPGTCKMIAAEAVEVGDTLYSAASGKVADTDSTGSSGYVIGKALTAATADGQIVEVLRYG